MFQSQVTGNFSLPISLLTMPDPSASLRGDVGRRGEQLTRKHRLPRAEIGPVWGKGKGGIHCREDIPKNLRQTYPTVCNVPRKVIGLEFQSEVTVFLADY